MDGFFPEKFLGEIFLDESLPPADQSDFLQYTEIPEIGFGQESFHVAPTSQNSKDEDEPLPPLNRGDFLRYRDLPRIEFERESYHNGSNSNQSAFVRYSDTPTAGFGEESSCSINVKDHGASPPANRSASVEYRELTRIGFGRESCHNGKISKRLIEFLRKSVPMERSNIAEYEKERGFRHMINERMRRQRQRQCCLALRSMLPYGTKNDINSVIQMAAKEIERLQAWRDELQRQNPQLEANVKGAESSIFQLRAANPTSPIDSMLNILKLLKGLGVNTKSISSNLSPQELSAMLEIEPKIGDAEVERAISEAASENAWKTRPLAWEASKRQRIGNEK